MTIANRIASTRVAMGLDQSEFAELISANVYTLRDWEQGRHKPRLPMLRKIAEATGHPLQWFLAEAGDALAPDAPPARALSTGSIPTTVPELTPDQFVACLAAAALAPEFAARNPLTPAEAAAAIRAAVAAARTAFDIPQSPPTDIPEE